MDDREWNTYKQGYLAAWDAATISVKRMTDNDIPRGKISLKLAAHLAQRLSIWQQSKLQCDPPECDVTFPEPADVRFVASTTINITTLKTDTSIP